MLSDLLDYKSISNYNGLVVYNMMESHAYALYILIQYSNNIQWLKKLSQCLAVSYYLTCNTMTSGGITLKQIHLIVYYISF
jgi:hypothetical protein